MPMNFPDMKSLERAARVHGFREKQEDETEERYRERLADHVEHIDLVESCEIRNKVGWDKFSDAQNLDILRRQFRKTNAGCPPT